MYPQKVNSFNTRAVNTRLWHTESGISTDSYKTMPICSHSHRSEFCGAALPIASGIRAP